jgi:hypothetical protein
MKSEYKEIDFSIYRIGLESGIAHGIAHNLIHNEDFDTKAYLDDCMELFITLGMDESLAKRIVDNGHQQGLIEYVSDSVPNNVDFAAQLFPSKNPRFIIPCIKLVKIARILGLPTGATQ